MADRNLTNAEYRRINTLVNTARRFLREHAPSEAADCFVAAGSAIRRAIASPLPDDKDASEPVSAVVPSGDGNGSDNPAPKRGKKRG